jgi:fatty-acyl-CoA synthase
LSNTIASLLLARAEDDGAAFLFEDRAWSYRQLVHEAKRRAALYAGLHDPARSPHIGVLLDNGPDYLFWLAAAALAGATIVGINSTYRGAQLAQLIEHTDCELLVTSSGFEDLLGGAGNPLAGERRLLVDAADYRRQLDAAGEFQSMANVAEDTLFLLIFTSGSTGMPKAVRCTQGRLARTGAHVAGVARLVPGDVVYSPTPFFHSSAIFSGWASALATGNALATRARFSASGLLPDIRKFKATFLTYVGKTLNYALAVPEKPDDVESPLRFALGNEASVHDIRQFARRFGCEVRDSYGSTEGLIVIRRNATMPEGALGEAGEAVKVFNPETGKECPRAEFGPAGQLLNADEATGEIVDTAPSSGFEGYYKNEAATTQRFRGGWYWSGDLAYRDAAGWFYFAGRSSDWLRVDGENFAAGPVEAIIGRHPEVRSVSVYAVPDDPVGDRVMAAIELRDGFVFDPAAFDEFLRAQPDLGPKWVPSFVRISKELPKLASLKLDKTRLRREAWKVEEIFWRPGKGQSLRTLASEDRRKLDPLLR